MMAIGKMGKYMGTANYTLSNGSVYDGDWKEGKMHGHGKYTYSNGVVYEGDWKEGKISRVRQIYLFKWRCLRWRLERRKLHGHGKYTYSNGDVYEGDWKEGQKTGHCKIRSPGGVIFEVDWDSGNCHGIGKWNVFPNHGIGKYTFPNGVIFEGNWNKGTLVNGKLAISEDSVLDSKLKLIFHGVVYKGKFDLTMSGNGKHKTDAGSFKNRFEYVGEFQNGRYEGSGKLIDRLTHTIYEGQWKGGEQVCVKITHKNPNRNIEAQVDIGICTTIKQLHKVTASDGKKITYLPAYFVEQGIALDTFKSDQPDEVEKKMTYEFDVEKRRGIVLGEQLEIKFVIDQDKGNSHFKISTPYWKIKGEIDQQLLGYGKLKWLLSKGDQCEVNFQNGIQEELRTSMMIYEGELFQALPHGYGKVIHPNGNIYEGEFEYKKPQGHGKFILAKQNKEIWVKWEYRLPEWIPQLIILPNGEIVERTNLYIERILDDPESFLRQRE